MTQIEYYINHKKVFIYNILIASVSIELLSTAREICAVPICGPLPYTPPLRLLQTLRNVGLQKAQNITVSALSQKQNANNANADIVTRQWYSSAPCMVYVQDQVQSKSSKLIYTERGRLKQQGILT